MESCLSEALALIDVRVAALEAANVRLAEVVAVAAIRAGGVLTVSADELDDARSCVIRGEPDGDSFAFTVVRQHPTAQ